MDGKFGSLRIKKTKTDNFLCSFKKFPSSRKSSFTTKINLNKDFTDFKVTSKGILYKFGVYSFIPKENYTKYKNKGKYFYSNVWLSHIDFYLNHHHYFILHFHNMKKKFMINKRKIYSSGLNIILKKLQDDPFENVKVEFVIDPIKPTKILKIYEN